MQVQPQHDGQLLSSEFQFYIILLQNDVEQNEADGQEQTQEYPDKHYRLLTEWKHCGGRFQKENIMLICIVLDYFFFFLY